MPLGASASWRLSLLLADIRSKGASARGRCGKALSRGAAQRSA